MSNTAVQAIAATPPVTTSTLLIFGVQLETWVLIANAIYIVLLLHTIIRDKYLKKNKEPTDE